MSPWNRSIDADHFERMYQADSDPWRFATSAYERSKYDATLAALAGEHIGRALEVGCAIGVLSQRLAAVCEALVAVDVSETALDQAKARCAGLANVELRLMALPAETPVGAFDVVLLSEVAYYWDDWDITRMGEVLRDKVAPGGRVLLVHWTGETDYPQTADGAVEKLSRAAGADFAVELAKRAPEYRLDLWRRSGRRP